MSKAQPDIIDLRSADAYAARRPAGAVHFQLDDLIERAYLLPPRSRPLLLVGGSSTDVQPVIHALESAGRCVLRHHPDESWSGSLPAETGVPKRNHLWEPAVVVQRASTYLGRLRGCEALDLACGSGRNAVFLSMAGMHVTAVDLLPDALERVDDLASRHGVHVRTLQRDLSDADSLRDLHADLIVVVRFLERGLFDPIQKALSPGGILAYETFVQGQPRPHPSNPRFLLQAGELRSAFPHLDTLEYEFILQRVEMRECAPKLTCLEEEEDRVGHAHIDRLIACRPAS